MLFYTYIKSPYILLDGKRDQNTVKYQETPLLIFNFVNKHFQSLLINLDKGKSTGIDVELSQDRIGEDREEPKAKESNTELNELVITPYIPTKSKPNNQPETNVYAKSTKEVYILKRQQKQTLTPTKKYKTADYKTMSEITSVTSKIRKYNFTIMGIICRKIDNIIVLADIRMLNRLFEEQEKQMGNLTRENRKLQANCKSLEARLKKCQCSPQIALLGEMMVRVQIVDGITGASLTQYMESASI